MLEPENSNNLKEEITDYLNNNNVSVNWVTENSGFKFKFNTNVRYEDDIGNQLQLKPVNELYNTMLHCIVNDSITCLLHHGDNGIVMLYYS